MIPQFEKTCLDQATRRAAEKRDDPDMRLTWTDTLLLDPTTTWAVLDKWARREVATDPAVRARRWIARVALGRTTWGF